MYKLETKKGRIALRDNSMIFGKTVFISEENEAYKYHVIDSKTHEEIMPCTDMTEIIVLTDDVEG